MKVWFYFSVENWPVCGCFSLSLQSMVEMVAENYHNIWAKKKKTELISKGALQNVALVPAAGVVTCVVNSIAAPRRRDPPAAGSL